jgi:hypothetical protein
MHANSMWFLPVNSPQDDPLAHKKRPVSEGRYRVDLP